MSVESNKQKSKAKNQTAITKTALKVTVTNHNIDENIHHLASTTESSEIFKQAEGIRASEVMRRMKSWKGGEYTDEFLSHDDFNYENFNLGQFLTAPNDFLGRLHKPITIHLLSILYDLNCLYECLNEKGGHGSFLTEIREFTEEMSGSKKGERNHSFWHGDNVFTGVVNCYMACIFGLKHSNSSDKDDVDYVLQNYAEANRAIGKLNIHARIKPDFFEKVKKAELFDSGRSLGTYGTLKSEIRRELRINPNIKSAELFRKFFNQTSGAITGLRTYEGEALSYDAGSTVLIGAFRSRVSEVRSDIKKLRVTE